MTSAIASMVRCGFPEAVQTTAPIRQRARVECVLVSPYPHAGFHPRSNLNASSVSKSESLQSLPHKHGIDHRSQNRRSGPPRRDQVPLWNPETTAPCTTSPTGRADRRGHYFSGVLEVDSIYPAASRGLDINILDIKNDQPVARETLRRVGRRCLWWPLQILPLIRLAAAAFVLLLGLHHVSHSTSSNCMSRRQAP